MGSVPVPDLSYGYEPLPQQAAFHASKAKFRLYGGAIRAGKTKAGSREALRTVVAFPGSLGIVGRLHYRRLKDSTLRTFMRELEETGLAHKRWSTFGKEDMELRFWNGSKIWFRNLEEYEQFQGVEPDWWFVDEGAEAPADVFVMLSGRLTGTPSPTGRHISKKVINGKAVEVRVVGPLRGWVCSNPGPNAWLHRNFLRRTHPDYEIIRAKTLENPWLPSGYVETLKQQFSGIWWRRFVEGDWSAFEGQAFPQFDPDRHVISGFRPERHHQIIEGYDFGVRVDTHVVWIAADPSGDWPPVVFAEHAASETKVEDHVKAIREVRKFYGLDEGKISCFGDPSGANRGPRLEDSSYMHLYGESGVWIAKSVKDPKVRALRLAQLLSMYMPNPDGHDLPGILFDARCAKTISSLVNLRWKEDHSSAGEDPREKFLKADDHGFDALSYGLMALEPPSPKRRSKPLPGVARYRHPDDEMDEEMAAVPGPLGEAFGIPQ